MRKSIIIFLAILLLSSPAIIIHFSVQTSSALMQIEHEKQLERLLRHDLEAQNLVTNPIFEISQNLQLFIFKTKGEVTAYGN